MGNDLIVINTVEEFTDTFEFPAATHTLIGIFNLADGNQTVPPGKRLKTNLYSVAVKEGTKGKAKYGWREYDFGKGMMSFFAPGQVLQSNEDVDHSETTGHLLIFHPDFISSNKLGANIGRYKFFSYDVNEALHLSETERTVIEAIFENMKAECSRYLDEHSHNIITSQLELLLNYAERFYTRQFRTRFSVESDLVTRFESILLRDIQQGKEKLITPGDIARELSMSTHYLSELLRNLTGMNTQQHIHAYLIEKAKTMLKTTELSISEIAYKLGFEYPQYFTRLFKQKTGQTPMQFRNMN